VAVQYGSPSAVRLSLSRRSYKPANIQRSSLYRALHAGRAGAPNRENRQTLDDETLQQAVPSPKRDLDGTNSLGPVRFQCRACGRIVQLLTDASTSRSPFRVGPYSAARPGDHAPGWTLLPRWRTREFVSITATIACCSHWLDCNSPQSSSCCQSPVRPV